MLTKNILLPVLAACMSLAAIGCSDDDDDIIVNPGASLRVVNDSDFVIEQIYLTPIDSPTWGSNLLRGDVLFPDEEILLGVACDFYDALVVDEVGVECEILDLDLCLNDATWVIRNDTCDVFEAAAKARAEEKAKIEAAMTTAGAQAN